MSQQYIFPMKGVPRLYEQKEVLSNIWLSFYPGAKIGVLGNNGSGKSTLLRIMAGADPGFNGHPQPAKALTIGYFSPEARPGPPPPPHPRNHGAGAPAPS